MEDGDLKGFIVKKLFHHNYVGGKHTSIDNLKKGLPTHIKGDVISAVKLLIKEQIILSKPTSYGVQVSLNPRKKQEIEVYFFIGSNTPQLCCDMIFPDEV
ncbi:hypothetical protein COV18_06540 [Candidatus Woesearchaeota archaeon CG10_big_fil_rev_8_21_14_0_10_37_12]|nr:MAG: hypothetical protein COV18_06540 [Candidatus Woesearchaeota archaeon CG10_big_fil_rev_8_21_14_0_10_37_12]